MMDDALLEELTKREMAARSAEHEDPVIQRALKLLGQAINPIKVVGHGEVENIYREAAPQRMKTKADKERLWGVAGFRRPYDTEMEDPNIYINKNHERYGNAKQKRDILAQMQLAGTLVHEQIHNTEVGEAGEGAARRKEADWFRSQIDKLPKWQQPKARELLHNLDVLAANNPRNVKRNK